MTRQRAGTPRRTDSAQWKRTREQARAQAIANNVTNCVVCSVGLDYEYSQRPNSAEVDHIIPHSRGGPDTLDNTRVICRWCNQRLGNGRKLAVPKPRVIEPDTGISW